MYESSTADLNILATSRCTPALPVAASARSAAQPEDRVKFAPPVIVSGSHDSGGSAVAGVLRKLGLWMADDSSLDDYLEIDLELLHRYDPEDYVDTHAGGDNLLWNQVLDESGMLPTVRKMVRDAYNDRYEGLDWAEDTGPDGVSDYSWNNALDATCAFWRDTMRRVPSEKRLVWGTKNAGTFLFFAGPHKSALGALSMVIVTRDARDVFPFGGLDEAVAAPGLWRKGAVAWARKNAEAIAWCLRRLPPGSCFLLRAEDMVYYPADTVGRLRDWLAWRVPEPALPELTADLLEKLSKDAASHRGSYGGNKWVRLLRDAPEFVAKRSLPAFEHAFKAVRGYSLALGYAGKQFETAMPADDAREGLPEVIPANETAPTYLECALSAPLETFVELTKSCPFWLWNSADAMCDSDGGVKLDALRESP